MHRFQMDCMEADSNFAMSCAVCCNEDYTGLEVHGNFRTRGDLGALVWWSEDFRMHERFKYPTSYDYSNTILSFEAIGFGTSSYKDVDQALPMTVIYKDGSEGYVTLGFCRDTTETSTSFSHANGTTLHEWVKWGSEEYEWTAEVVIGYEDIFDENGIYVETVPIYETQSGSGSRGTDYVIDYKQGILLPTGSGSIPYNASVKMTYEYHTGDTYIINFNNLVQGEHPSNASYLKSTNIEKIFFPIIPIDYIERDYKTTGKSIPFEMKYNNWLVTGGEIGEVKPPVLEHNLKMAEGYDDEYYRNPKRLVESIHHLGYRDILNLYIGASHYYDKQGELGLDGLDHKTQYLIQGHPLNKAFEAWFTALCKELYNNQFKQLVISISMEILQMPEGWKQRMHDGVAGQTGWMPPTSFISPCSDEAKTYMKTVANTLINITKQYNIEPILQLGEPWWWFQEFEPGNVQIPFDGKPPCFYDANTQAKFKKENGYDIPVWATTDVEMTAENIKVCNWLQQQLGNYSNFFREIAHSNNIKYTILFFPPSVMDKDRVPKCMQIANVPKSAWQYPMLDLIQIEDYDWLIHNNPNHRNVLNFAREFYGYPDDKVHYFAGFAWREYNLPLELQWERIKKSALLATGVRQQVFIWAGTQVRRDSWTIEGHSYGSMSVPLTAVKKIPIKL